MDEKKQVKSVCQNLLPLLFSLFLAVMPAACGSSDGGDGGDSGGSSTDSYTIGGTVTGLTGTVVLQNNGGDDLTVTDESFVFGTELNDGADYNVEVLSHPTGQTCTVSNGSGTVSGDNVSDVTVTCVDTGNPTYTVGGAVTGLTGTVVLQNNGGDDLTVSASPFTFQTALPDSSTYDVKVSVQPEGQTCSVTGGQGTISGADVTTVLVVCLDNVAESYVVRVQSLMSTLTGDVVLQNNGGDNITIELSLAGSTVSFPNPLPDGSAYDITILSEPGGVDCYIFSNQSGVINGADVLASMMCVPDSQPPPV